MAPPWKWVCDSEVPHKAGGCKDCRRVYQQRYRERNLAKNSAAQMAWAKRNPEKTGVYQRRYNLKRNGWTEEAFHEAVAAQMGRCAVCGRAKELEADHCHKTGQARAPICQRCNRILSLARDDRALLAAASLYLAAHEARILALLNSKRRVIDAVRTGELEA